jgi:hypothetical protein
MFGRKDFTSNSWYNQEDTKATSSARRVEREQSTSSSISKERKREKNQDWIRGHTSW